MPGYKFLLVSLTFFALIVATAGPVLAVPPAVQAKSAFLLADDLFKKGDYPGAIEHAEKAMAILGSTNPRIEYLLTKAYLAVGNYTKSYAAMDAFFKVTPESESGSPTYAEMVALYAQIEAGKNREEDQRKISVEATGELVNIPGGCYPMGDIFGVGETDENPAHEVCLDGFSLGKTEVTVAQFRRFVEATGYRTEAELTGGCTVWTGSAWEKAHGKSWRDPGFAQGDRHPVACVSWNDAHAMSTWLSELGGMDVRLPTEAEWEYAARSGGKKEFYAGGENLEALAWFDANSSNLAHPVGLKQANSLGLYDMAGNLWEWCEDRYTARYYADSPRNNPMGPYGGSVHVNRGGSWAFDSGSARSTKRVGSKPDVSRYDLGFRLAVSTGRQASGSRRRSLN